MSQITESAERSVKRLRSAITQGNDALIDKAILGVEKALLDDQAYAVIGDERLLAEALALLSDLYGETTRQKLDGLRQHLELMRAVHDKLFAILDPGVGLEELLYLHLSEWPSLEQPIMCRFSDETKRKLHDIRCDRKSDVVVEEFTRLVLQNFENEGFGEVVKTLSPYIELGLNGYRRNARWTVHALFASGLSGEVRGIRIRASKGGGDIRALDSIDPDMRKASMRAMEYVRSQWPPVKEWDLTWEIGRDDIAFAGDSIGLALAIGILAVTGNVDIDPYTGFTGHVEWDTGDVKQVGHLDAKLRAAVNCGIRRVFVPRDNLGDDVVDDFDLNIVEVSSVKEAQEHLESRNFEHANTPLERLAEAKLRELEIELKNSGITKASQTQPQSYQKRAEFTDWREEAIVDVYHSKRLNAQVGGKDSNLKERVRQVVDRVFGERWSSESQPGTKKDSRAKYSVSAPHLQQRIRDHVLDRDNAIKEEEQNCLYRAKIVGRGQVVYVRQYNSGTLTVSGPEPLFGEVNEPIQGLLGIDDLSSVDGKEGRERSQVAAVEAVDVGDQWIGTDESGKGDYFGPLVGAAVLVDKRIAGVLDELGVRDSKRLSDKRNQELASKIRQACGERAQVVVIPPERYNALYSQFKKEGKNLNTLLAWAHTRAMENILTFFPQDEITVLVDKFADESFIHSKLLEKGRRTNLNLVQLPKAEANVAVAAASILARAQFLDWLERLSAEYNVEIPKGASDPRILEVGSLIVRRHGRTELAKVAKLHFRTTDRILEKR